jgi:hypothetical protein
LARLDMLIQKTRPHNRDYRQQFYEALGRSQPCILGLAARFHNVVKHFNLPAQGVSGKFFDGLLKGGNW